MSVQHNLELKEKAKKFVIEKRWDYLLVNTYLETKYFYSWSKDDEFDFEKETNFGLTNISSEIRILECGYKKNDNNDFLVASFNDINFKIGGFRDTSYMPDGDAYTTLSIVLLIDEKVVLSIRYSEESDDPYRANDYRLVSVEELHSSEKITKLLVGIEIAIDEKKEKENLKRKHEENNSYEGKFTFDLEETEQKASVADKLGRESTLVTNSTDHKKQDKPYVIFLKNNFVIIFMGLLFIFIAIFG
jgi:hypothetical protein